MLLSMLAAASLPPQYPAYYETHYFTQRVDHFNAQDNRTFRERYLVNATHWGGTATRSSSAALKAAACQTYSRTAAT